jgi:hypothetical protein
VEHIWKFLISIFLVLGHSVLDGTLQLILGGSKSVKKGLLDFYSLEQRLTREHSITTKPKSPCKYNRSHLMQGPHALHEQYYTRFQDFNINTLHY